MSKSQLEDTLVQETESRITRLILKELSVASGQLTQTASFVKDLGIDSLDAVVLIMNLEREFDIEIPDHDIDRITDLNATVRYVCEKLREKTSLTEDDTIAVLETVSPKASADKEN